MPREWLTRFSGRLLRPASTASRPPIDVHNEIVAPAAAERVWDLLADVEGWPSWYRACRWVRVESSGRFRWKAHPIALRSTVVASDRPDSFTFIADAAGCYRHQPACFKWAAMAAIASHHIRLVLSWRTRRRPRRPARPPVI
jgi:hypothetical protein